MGTNIGLRRAKETGIKGDRGAKRGQFISSPYLQRFRVAFGEGGGRVNKPYFFQTCFKRGV